MLLFAFWGFVSSFVVFCADFFPVFSLGHVEDSPCFAFVCPSEVSISDSVGPLSGASFVSFSGWYHSRLQFDLLTLYYFHSLWIFPSRLHHHHLNFPNNFFLLLNSCFSFCLRLLCEWFFPCFIFFNWL